MCGVLRRVLGQGLLYQTECIKKSILKAFSHSGLHEGGVLQPSLSLLTGQLLGVLGPVVRAARLHAVLEVNISESASVFTHSFSLNSSHCVHAVKPTEAARFPPQGF